MTEFAVFFEQLHENAYIMLGNLYPVFTHVVRYIIPILIFWILIRCAVSLLSEKQVPEEWGYLTMPGGVRTTLNHWENTIGRAKSADIHINYPTVSRSHAALIRRDSGDWTIYDLNSKTGVLVNASPVEDKRDLTAGDIINIGGVDMVFVPIDRVGERIQAEKRRRFSHLSAGGTLFLLNLVQLILTIQYFASNTDFDGLIPIGFFCLSVLILELQSRDSVIQNLPCAHLGSHAVFMLLLICPGSD